MKLVITYFGQTALISSKEEAVTFINNLNYRGSSKMKLVANNYCSTLFEEHFSGKNLVPDGYGLATTNCSTTRILIYHALAETLEGHNLLVRELNDKKRKEAEGKRLAREQELLAEMYQQAKGWYVVTLEVLVSKIKGNDGTKTYSFKVLADNQVDAYNKACQLVMNGGLNDRNVSFVYHIKDSMFSALIEYVGVWTDEATLEYGS